MSLTRWVVCLALCMWCAAQGTQAAEAARQIRAEDPPSLAVGVEAGEAKLPDGRIVSVKAGTLHFDPAEVREDTLSANGKSWEGEWGSKTLHPIAQGTESVLLGGLYYGVITNSVVVKSGDSNRTFKAGEDYSVTPEFGEFKPVPDRLPDSILITYRYITQRLDLVQVSPDGTVSVKKGQSAVVCPALPAADVGCASLAGIYVYHANHPDKRDVITQDDILPIRPAAPVAPFNPLALKKTMAKLRDGKNVTIAFLGDSITVGAEGGKWWCDRSQTFSGKVMKGLASKYPKACLAEVTASQGATSSNDSSVPLFIKVMQAARTPKDAVVIWWEAEAAVEHNFPPKTEFSPNNSREADCLSGGAWLTSEGVRKGDPIHARYEVQVPVAGKYKLWTRRFFDHGSYKYRWDGGVWKEVRAGSLKIVDSEEIRSYLAATWTIPVTVDELGAGKHKLEIELLAKEGEKQVSGFDCFALIRKEKEEEKRANQLDIFARVRDEVFLPCGKWKPGDRKLESVIWWEGETPEAHNFPESREFLPNTPDEKDTLSGGAWLQTKTQVTDKPLFANYTVKVPEKEDYTFWVRKYWKHGPFRWRFDDQPWAECGLDVPLMNSMELRPDVSGQWACLGPVGLSAGKHTLHIELTAKPGQDVIAGFDCFALAKGLFVPNGPRQPQPGEWYVDAVVLALGMNDTWMQTKETKEGLGRYVKAFKEAGIEVVLVTPMAPSPFLERKWKAKDGDRCILKSETAKAIMELAQEEGVAAVDVYTEWQNLATRGILPFSQLHNCNNHPGPFGHGVYADAILRAFE